MTHAEIKELLDWDDEAPPAMGEKVETYDEWEEKRRKKMLAVEILRVAPFLLCLILFAGCSVKATNEIVLVPDTEIVFTDVVGGAWPTPFPILVLPSTNGTWTSHDTSPWFDTAPHNSGSAGDPCILKPHTEHLSAGGPYSQLITFRSAGLPDKVAIISIFMLTEPPTPTPSATPTPTPPVPTPTPRPSIGPQPTAKLTPTPSPGPTARPTPPGIAATAPPEVTPSDQVLLSWMPSSTPPGSMPIAGYRVYWGLAPATYSQQKSVGLATTATIYAPQQSWFAVKAYNTVGIESAYSNEVRHP